MYFDCTCVKKLARNEKEAIYFEYSEIYHNHRHSAVTLYVIIQIQHDLVPFIALRDVSYTQIDSKHLGKVNRLDGL
jgi:hypothetical protein